MAKKLNVKKDEINEEVNETEEVKVNETVTIGEEDVDKKESKKAEPKKETVDIKPNTDKPIAEKPQTLKKIKLREDHRCHIGGTNYRFSKGEVYTVPVQVKEILSNAGLLVPLD